MTAEELLMMFIKDAYNGKGSPTKKTAIAMMNFVSSDNQLQAHVNASDWKSVLSHKLKSDVWVSVDDHQPGVGERCIIYTDNKNVVEAEYWMDNKFNRFGRISVATHWQKLTPPVN